MDFWAIYIFPRGVSGILVETGRFFSARTMAFYGFNSSFRAIFFLTLPPLSKNWSKKRNRCRWGGGQEALFSGEILVFRYFANGGPRGGTGKVLVVC